MFRLKGILLEESSEESNYVHFKLVSCVTVRAPKTFLRASLKLFSMTMHCVHGFRLS